MINKEKNNVGIIIFLGILVIVLLVVVVILSIVLVNIKNNQQSFEDNNQKNDEILNDNEFVNENESDEIVLDNDTTENILDKSLGEWGICTENGGCYGLIIAKNIDNKYTYNPYVMWSDGGNTGTINSVETLGDNKYKLSIYFPARESAGASYNESTENVIITINDNDIEINGNRYQKIIGDREAFFQSLIK